MCVLVVEDDFLIRLILVEELADAGFQVKEAETADQAAGMLIGMEPPLSVLVTDIHMPGNWTGIDLAAHVRVGAPDLPTIFTTGRPDAISTLEKHQTLIRKPYVPRTVITAIQRFLA